MRPIYHSIAYSRIIYQNDTHFKLLCMLLNAFIISMKTQSIERRVVGSLRAPESNRAPDSSKRGGIISSI